MNQIKTICMTPNPSGAYPNIQSSNLSMIPEGHAFVPEELSLKEFYEVKGFIKNLQYEQIKATEEQPGFYVLVAYEQNLEAYAEYLKEFPEPDPVDAAKDAKLTDISAACRAAIESGQDITLSDGKSYHFDYTIEDQSNISSMWNAVSAGATCFPYHAKGGMCTIYSAADIVTIYMTLAGLQTAQTTYHNQLKAMIKSLDSVDDVESVVYGQPLEGIYLDTYNQMMKTAQEQMAKVLTNIQAMQASYQG